MKNNDLTILKSASEQDILLFNMSDCYEIADEEMIKGLAKNEDIKTYIITEPCDEFPFLHEGAVIEFHGRLYMFINQMVSADHIHTLDLYVYNQTENTFERIWSKAIPFKLNTNVYKLPSGKLMICGRTGDLDGFPATPAVLISDSGKIDADWRIVKIQENEFLPDGRKFEHPETSAIICGKEIYVFCRNDYSDMPILYISRDEGETSGIWHYPCACEFENRLYIVYSADFKSDGTCSKRGLVISVVDLAMV